MFSHTWARRPCYGRERCPSSSPCSRCPLWFNPPFLAFRPSRPWRLGVHPSISADTAPSRPRETTSAFSPPSSILVVVFRRFRFFDPFPLVDGELSLVAPAPQYIDGLLAT